MPKALFYISCLIGIERGVESNRFSRYFMQRCWGCWRLAPPFCFIPWFVSCRCPATLAVKPVSDSDVISWARLNLNQMVFLPELIPDKTSRIAFYDRMHPCFVNRKTLAFQLIQRACETGEDTGCLFEIRAFCCACFHPRIRDPVVL